jgi:flagellar protein FlaF
MSNPYAAYQATAKKTLSDRLIQAHILRRASTLFRSLQENWSTGEDLLTALKYNQVFWTYVQSDAGDENSPLPKDLRINLLRLAGYVDKRTFEIIADPSPEKLTVLININNNLAAGLEE